MLIAGAVLGWSVARETSHHENHSTAVDAEQSSNLYVRRLGFWDASRPFLLGAILVLYSLPGTRYRCLVVLYHG